MDDGYGLDGPYGALVAAVLQQCSCEREHAVAALKVYKNDLDQAVTSITRSRPRRLLSTTRHRLDFEDKVVDLRPDIDTRASHGYIAENKGSGTPKDNRDTNSALQQGIHNAHNRPESPIRNPDDFIGLKVVTPDIHSPSERERFQLPKLRFTNTGTPFDPKEGRSRNFSLDRLTWAVQDGLSATDGREYLAYFQRSEVSAVINRQVAGVPSVFYAVETNNEALIRTWVEYGADVNALEPGTGLPLLAFAILNSTQHDGGSMLVLRILLSNGADVTVIPSYLLEPIHPENDASTQARPLKKDASQTWCNGVIEKMVENSLTVSQKYFIRRRSRHPAPSSRFIQVAREYQLTELCGLPFTMIGQDLSIEMLTNRLLTHLITPTTKPLVLTFAGPSGHGKTEVGRRLGDLLSLKMLVVDMTQIKHETDLFGPYSPYVGYEKGSPLNNFLADNSGRKAIVMLDEIEKSGSKIMDANLIVFDEGRYQDRRSRMKVNCTNIIWILATNALDSKINEFSEMKFAKQHNSEAFNPKLKDALVATLFRGMKEEFGAPLSRRVSAIIPFLPFFLEEQMVIAYKYLLELKSRLRQPIAPRSK